MKGTDSDRNVFSFPLPFSVYLSSFFNCLIEFIHTCTYHMSMYSHITSNSYHSRSLSLSPPYPLQQISGIVALSISIYQMHCGFLRRY